MGVAWVGGAAPGIELEEDCMGFGHQVETHCPKEHRNARQATNTAPLERLFAFLAMVFAVFEITFESTLILFASLLIPSASLLRVIASRSKASFSWCLAAPACAAALSRPSCSRSVIKSLTRWVSRAMMFRTPNSITFTKPPNAF